MDTGAEGGNVVFVKVRETYDLHTVKNKMSVIAVHTPKPNIIKRNYPGLLMQCKAYRPVSADVRIACASMQSLDPLQVGTETTDIAPEDVFNPILYKAMSNFGMSQLEARINYLTHARITAGRDVDGDTSAVDVDSTTSLTDEFDVYYGLLSETHSWKHANPQAGLEMIGLRPLVYEMLYNVGDNDAAQPSVSGDQDPTDPFYYAYPQANGNLSTQPVKSIRGNAKPMPFINTTSYTRNSSAGNGGYAAAGFDFADPVSNASIAVPTINVVVGAIIIPPSRLHELFYRMVVEWTLEFSMIRPLSDIVTFAGLATIGSKQHYQNYDYSETKKALTGTDDTILDSDSCMVSANVDVNKVM